VSALFCYCTRLGRWGISDGAGTWPVSGDTCTTTGLDEPAVTVAEPLGLSGFPEPATNCRNHAMSRLALLYGYIEDTVPIIQVLNYFRLKQDPLSGTRQFATFVS